MRLRGIRLPLLAALFCAGVGLFIWATDRTYGDTIYYPTIAYRSPYVVSTSYVLPTSYVSPSYIETSYAVSPAVSLLPTGYIETTYRRGLFGRRWVVERPVVAAYPAVYVPTTYVSSYVPTTYVSSYVPTTYVSSYVPTTYVAPTYYSSSYVVGRYRPTSYTYYPTVYATAYRSAADLCCDQVVVDSPVSAAPQSSLNSPLPPRNSNEVGSSSLEDSTGGAYVNPPANEATRRSTARNEAAATKADAKRADSPPEPQAPDADEEAALKKAAAKAAGGGGTPKKNGGATQPSKKASTPVAPTEGTDDAIDLRTAPKDEEVLRSDSMKPSAYPRMRTVSRQNVLFGTVEDNDRRPREEVPVIVVNRFNSSIRRTGVSDAYGSFAIRVPDGQWVVRVTMPSGNTQPVRDITVTGGRVVDNVEAKEVRNLIISY